MAVAPKVEWIDPDDAPELTPELARRAQISVGGKVVREATGTVTKLSDEMRGSIVGAPAMPEDFE